MSEQGIAPTLIVARVASGEARTDDSWRNSEEVTGELSALRFDGSDEESTSTYEMHNDGLPTSVTMKSTTGDLRPFQNPDHHPQISLNRKEKNDH